MKAKEKAKGEKEKGEVEKQKNQKDGNGFIEMKLGMANKEENERIKKKILLQTS